MKRVLVYCEGVTEETFVNQILAKELLSQNIIMKASQFGGVTKKGYRNIKRDLTHFCKNDSSMIVTTMIDYYALPENTPGRSDIIQGTIYDKVCHIEKCIAEDIGVRNLIPNLMLHEFEALLFAKPECFSFGGLTTAQIGKLTSIKNQFETPEHINDNVHTAPSKRILEIYPSYKKVIDGSNIAKNIGLITMQKECRHFAAWLNKLRAIQ